MALGLFNTEERLFINGQFFAADASWKTSVFHDAMFVQDGIIEHIGKRNDSFFVELENRDNGPSIVDLEGRMVLPGFIDGHMHLLLLGQSLTKLDLDGCKDLDDIRSRIGKYAREHPQQERILCRGWMHSMTNGLARASMLNDLDPRPIFIDSKDLHSTWCNNAALEELNIWNMPDPVGGTIERDPVTGRPTGLLSEACTQLITWPHLAMVATMEDKLKALDAAVQAYHAAGYTGAIDMAMDENGWAAVQALKYYRPQSTEETLQVLEHHHPSDLGESLPTPKEHHLSSSGEALQAPKYHHPPGSGGRLTIKLAAHWLITPSGTEEERLAQVDRAIQLHKFTKDLDPTEPRVVGIKVICDGVIDACTAALCEPYSTNGANGEPIWTAEMLGPVVQKADAAGLQCALHAIGDAAVRTAIDIIEKYGTPGRRHRIEHLELTRSEDAARLGKLGITASVQPVHSDPAILRAWPKLLGEERLGRAFAYKEFLDGGAVLAIGSDSPTAPYAPIPNLYVATTRKSARDLETNDAPVNEHFKLGLCEAITAGTRGSAYSCFEENRVGNLEAGKRADFVIMDMEFDAAQLLKAKVWQTWSEGEVRYASELAKL
ncbi:amidohydrolase 3 [Delitschia confertaspora ATCC 74209]|uniref:Amidohydrolase 3 n=1 Tax=Delitschia confertaspora ATCC 74209 TaxID=1513339 RepID=A0A9P4JCI4_9PLEO|nr:amidohydrolase 3 [Delitschia confertaspora ATCC 74209]